MSSEEGCLLFDLKSKKTCVLAPKHKILLR
jgi:hypothetical protein